MITTRQTCAPLITKTRRAPETLPTQSDRFAFFRAWAANPLQVASITPSGDALSELITSEITPATGPVVELGPGTGVFTRALLERGVKEQDITLVEYGSEFALMLKNRFPDARVLWMDARRVGQLAFDDRGLGAVVSGLPLLSMPTLKVFQILKGSFDLMGSDGRFYQFTYGPRCPVSTRILDRLGLKAVNIGRTSLNIPPASVYRISKRRPIK